MADVPFLFDGGVRVSEAQLLDAIAIGQFTPGPLFTTATFIGYLLGGAPGAIVATIGIFLPAFVFVAISGPLIPRLRRSPVAGAVLDGVNVGSPALMAVVTLHLGVAALVDWPTIGLAATAAILLIHFRINSAWLVLGGAVAGTLIKGVWWPRQSPGFQSEHSRRLCLGALVSGSRFQRPGAVARSAPGRHCQRGIGNRAVVAVATAQI